MSEASEGKLQNIYFIYIYIYIYIYMVMMNVLEATPKIFTLKALSYGQAGGSR